MFRLPFLFYLKGVETVVALTKKQKLKRIMSDFKLFAKNFIYIVDTRNQKIRFELNSAQKELDELIENNRFVIVNKARKAGVSTYMLAKALWRCCTRENESILIVSYESDSSKNLFEVLKKMNMWLPRDKYPDLFPETRRDNRDELLFDNGSRIVCTVAGNKEIARGFSPTWVHLSEFAHYANQEKQLLSVEQALIDNGKLTIETTSNGTNNHYYKLFMAAYKGNSKYKPYFIPFYHELYKEQNRNQHDEAEEWFKANNRGNRLREKDLEPDEKILYEKGANLRFLMWRRYKLLDMTLHEFYQEYPSNPMESFISTGQSVFDQSKVLERLQYVKEPMSKEVVLEESIDFPEILKQYINRGLYIYKLPKKGIRMFGGVDTASGSGSDYSTVTIFDNEGEQVLIFYHNKVPVYLFAEIVDAIGKWCNYAFLAIERNNLGLPLIERLRKDYEYMNLLKQKVFDQKGKKKLQLGWTTTNTSKSIMISDFKEQFERGLISIHCKETLQQMQLFQEVDGKMNNKKGEGNHDDLIISAALVVQAMKQNKYYVDIA
jgi:hypothetical protein